MSRFYRNLILILLIIGLIVFLFFRFIESYTSTMHRVYSPDDFEQYEPEETDSDTVTIPANSDPR